MRKKDDNQIAKFKEFLRMINLTKDFDFWSFETHYKSTLRIMGNTSQNQSEAHELAAEKIGSIIEQSSEFCFYLAGVESLKDASETTFMNGVRAYEDFLRSKITLEAALQRINIMRYKNSLPKGSEKALIGITSVQVKYEINSQGFLEYETIDYSKFKNINLMRAKNCLECNNLFYQERSDAKFCSIKCGNTSRQKRWLKDETHYAQYLEVKRKKYYDDHEKNKERQRHNYAYKKSIKK